MLFDRVQVICFDIGGTLVRMPRGTLATEIATLLGVEQPHVRDLLIEHGKRRQTTPAQLAERLARECHRPDAINQLTDVLNQRRSDVEQPELYPDALEALPRLAEAGWRIFYLSNAVGYTDQQNPSYYKFAEAVLHSWQLGVCTPDRQAFDTVTSLAQVQPHVMLHVGDSWESDIRGAIDAGWQAAYLDRDGIGFTESNDVPRITDLIALLELLPSSPGAHRPRLHARRPA